VIVCDANLLIYSYNTGSARHAKARAWLEEIFSGIDVVGLPWQAASAFLRVMTNRKLPGERFSLLQAAQIVDLWLANANVRVLIPGDHYWPLFRRMLIEGQASGALVSDAEIAALTIEYGGVLYTADRDFARFPGLRWKNPLE
jgi:toxin-antitoxin system PIN domain toxin